MRHPYLITALFEIRPVAYFGPKQDTFDQKTIFFLLQYSKSFSADARVSRKNQFFLLIFHIKMQ